ncbi:MAG: phosphatase PAP2 family protein [Bacilli bacterium]|nr:phosphatase PAP2 family protein [Bacilli bacterium]
MIQEFDYAILDFIQETLRSKVLDEIMKFITHLGDNGIFWIILCIILLIIPKTRHIGFIGLLSLLFSLLINDQIIKNIVTRERPFVSREDIELIIKAPSGYSFPSGHTSSSFGVAFVFSRFFKKQVAIPVFILAGLIAFSRLYLYVHFPTDVLVGIFVGLLNSFLAVLVFKQGKKVYIKMKK